MGRKKKAKREYEEVKIYCFYCDRQFRDEETLIEHQRAKHFKCEVCNKKLSTAKGLATHCYQVHRVDVKTVPSAKDNRGSIEFDIYGMVGVDEALRELGELPDEPEPKVAKPDAPVVAAAVAPVAVPLAPGVAPVGIPQIGVIPPHPGAGAPPHPGAIPPPYVGQPYPAPYPYAPPPVAPYGYPPHGGHPPPGYYPGWPPRPGAPPPYGVPAPPGAWGPPHPHMGGPPPGGMPPPRAPLFPVLHGTSAPPSTAPTSAASAAVSAAPPAADLNGTSDAGLVWQEEEMSMEERRASLAKYISPAKKPAEAAA